MHGDVRLRQVSLLDEVNALNWVHQIDLGNGIITPGRWPPHPLILKAFDVTDFRGKKVLDIGCWDGLWSFEAERRGAEVYATDYVSQRSYQEQPTFSLAHKALGSKVKYHPRLSVYDVESLGSRDFDVILFCGVYYHLRHPLEALSRIRRVVRKGATVIVEGDVLLDTDECFARFFYRDSYHGDASNWWIPTRPCLRQWIESSFFEVTHEFVSERRTSIGDALKRPLKRVLGRDCCTVARCVVVAKAVCRADPKYVFPDDDFSEFDKNVYE